MNVERVLTTVDTHTAGGPTRTVIGGLPQLEGGSVAEKMDYFQAHFDSIRKLLMLEPRGHNNMYGAVLTCSTEPTAAIGAFFITSAGYLRACVHSSIGLVTAGLNTGFIPHLAFDKGEAIRMEVPAGLVSVRPCYRNRRLSSVAIQLPQAFVCSTREHLLLDSGRTLEAALVYSGVFFVLVNAKELDMLECPLTPQNARKIAKIGVDILAAANRRFIVSHPENPSINGFDLVMIYENVEDRHARDIVINRTGSIDRSPCGAGTGAIMTYLFTLSKLQVGQDYVLESFLGTRFMGRIVGPVKVGSFEGAVPEIEGTAYVTGMHHFLLDNEDPFREGLSF